MNRTQRVAAVAIVVSLLIPLQARSEDHSLLDGIGRGFANIVVGWLEIPRGITYYAVEYPVIGVIPGALEGGGMTLIRAIGGLVDVVTIGYLPPGRTVYDTMDAPMMPWESPWLPPDDENEE